MKNSLRVLALAALLAAAATHAAPPPPPAVAPAVQAAANARAKQAAARALPARKPETIKPVTSLPTLAEVLRGGPATQAASDTFLIKSSAFDVLGGGCDPRGWVAEERANRVFAHVSERFKVNADIFSWTPATTRPVLPSAIAGTPIMRPRHIAVNDSGMVFFVEEGADTHRVIALYPDQNFMREYAVLIPSQDGYHGPIHIAYDKATGGLILGANWNIPPNPPLNTRGGRLLRVPAGGGTPVEIAGGGYTSFDASAFDAAIDVPEEIITDTDGNIYFVEIGYIPSSWPRVRMLRASDSQVVTLAGMLFWAADGADGVPGTSSSLYFPRGLTMNAAEDTLYILDALPRRIRSLSLVTGIIDALPGAQSSDFEVVVPGSWTSPYSLAFADSRIYVGCYGGLTVAWSAGAMTHVAGQGTSLVDPAEASLGTRHSYGGTIEDQCPAPGGGVLFVDDGRALIHRLDPTNHVSAIAGVHGSMYMGEKTLWFGADETSAPDEVAGWMHPHGYGGGWGQRLTSPEFSFLAHPNAQLSFDARVDIRTSSGGVHEETLNGFFAVRGLQADGTWAVLPMSFVTDETATTSATTAARVSGRGIARCVVDLASAPLADLTRLQILVQTDRFESNEDGWADESGHGALLLDNVRLTDGGDVLPALDFEDGTTGGWTLSALNAAYGNVNGLQVLRDFEPPATDVALRTGFDFSDPTCVWTFTSAGDSVRNGVYSRLTSPWLKLADRNEPTFITFSGKLATDNQKRYLKAFLRGKNAGDTRPVNVLSTGFILSSGTSGSDLASPYLNQYVLQYPDDFGTGTEGGFDLTDSIQIVLQIEDRLEEESENFPDPRVPSRLPYLDDLRVYQLAGDQDGDGVRDDEDACPAVSAEGQDEDGNGCPDATATLRHVESWNLASRPIRFRITENGDPAIAGGSDLQAIRDAIAAWTSVPGAAAPLVEEPVTPQTNAAALDGINLITWDDELQFSPDILAITPTTSFVRRAAFDDAIVLPGQIVDSDLIFNTAATYRTSATGPIPNSVDLQSVATHEIGHLLGLSHSGVAEATMFPVLQSGTDASSLEPDDHAAIRAAYPGATYATGYATLTGTVVRGSNSQPIPGALVTAWALDGSDLPLYGVASDYTDEAGGYALRGLSPGYYGIKVEPLDGAVPALIPAAINARVLAIAQTNFTGEWWSAGDNGTDAVDALTGITVAAGAVSGGHDVVTSIDVTPPTIQSVLPADAASSVGISGRVLLNVSEPVEASTMIAAFYLRKTGDTGRMGGQAQFVNNNQTFIFTPDDVLDFGTSYEIEVTTDLTDRQGVPLASTYVAHFTTLPQPAVAIFDIQPRQAPPGALITIRGAGLSGNLQFEWRDEGGPVITSGGGFGTGDAYLTRIDENIVSGPVRVIADGDTSNAFNLTVLQPSPGVPTPVGAPVGLSFAPTDVVLSPEGMNAFAVGEPGLATINLSPTRPLYRAEDFQSLPGARRVAMARDGRRLFVARPDSSDLAEADADTTSAGFGHAFVRIPLPGPPGGVYAIPDGVRVLVSEDLGSRAWLVDIDPSSATYRGVLREYTLEGVTLTGGLGVSTSTETALASSRTASPRGPRLHAEGYDTAFLTSSTHGIVTMDLSSGFFEPGQVGPRSADHLEVTLDGDVAVAIGAGSDEGTLPRACLLGSCFGIPDPILTLGGRPRDLVANPRTGGFFVVNSIASELQVLQPSGNALALVGQTGTGRTPVAVAIDASGSVTAVANAGDRTIGFYGVASSTNLVSVQPAAAFPGDFVVARLASGSAAGHTADLGGGPIAPSLARDEGLAFSIPAHDPGTVSVTLDGPAGRTLSLPLEIVAPITTLAPRATGEFMLAPLHQDDWDGPSHTTHLVTSRDGRTLAALSAISDAFAQGMIYQLRDDAPEPLYAELGELDFPYFDYPQGAAFSLDGRRLWTAAGYSGAYVWDVDPASPFFGQSLPVSESQGAMAIAADPLTPRMFIALKGYDDTHFLVDALDASLANLFTLDFSIADSIRSLAVSPDGRVLVIGGMGQAYFVDLSTNLLFPGSPTPLHAGTGTVHWLAITGDGRRAVGVFLDGTFAVWNLEPGHEGEELHYGEVSPGVALSSAIAGLDPHSVLSSGSDGNLWRIDVAGAVPALSTAPLALPAPVIARTLDGRHLFAAGRPQGAYRDTMRVYAMSEATALTVVSGADQEALIGTELPLPVRVRLSDAQGRAQAGAVVEFSTSQGSIPGGPVVRKLTDANGTAEVLWTMPGIAGPVALTVRAPGLPIDPLGVNALSSESATTAVPQITAFGPPDGATGLSALGEVFVRFSQAMDSLETTPRVTLSVGTDVIPGSYRYEEGGRVVYFKPGEPLPHLASCKLRVQAGALDLDGQTLAAADSSSFTTQAEPALTIAVVSPPAGAPGAVVTLNGQGFSPVPALNLVTFGTELASVLTATPTTLIARVPSTATVGPVRVQVASVNSNTVPFVVLPVDPVPGTVVDTLPTPPEPLRLVLTPDGRRAYVVSPRTNAVGVLDIFTAEDLAVIPVGSNPRAITMLPDGSRAYVANRDGANVSVISTNPDSAGYNRVVGTIKVGPRPVAIAAIYGGPQVVVVCEGDSSARIIDAQRDNATFDQVVKNVPLPSSGSSVAISPDGGLLFVITTDRRLVVIDVSPNSATPNRVVKNVPLPSSGSSVAISPDGSLLFVTLVDDGSVLVYVVQRGSSSGDGSSSPSDGLSLNPLETHATGTAPAACAVDPFGAFIVVANQGSNDLTVLLTNEAPPHVEVTHPNGGETLLPGASATLTWSTDRFPVGQFVDVLLSRDLGAMWDTIATDIPNTGAFDWMVTGPPTATGPIPHYTALIEVRARNPYGATDVDRSDAPFTIFDAVTPALLTQFAAEPRAGAIELRWQFAAGSGVRSVTVERADAAEGPWTPLAADLHTEAGAVVARDATARQGRVTWYRLAVELAEGGITRFGPVSATLPVAEFALEPVSPNPSHGPVAIAFAVARETPVKVSVIDISGRRVATLVDGVREAGLHRFVWNGVANGGRVSAGLYFVSYEAGGLKFTRRFALTR